MEPLKASSCAGVMHVTPDVHGDDRGSLEPGKRADLLIARGLPLDLSDMRNRIRWVVQAGKVVVANP